MARTGLPGADSVKLLSEYLQRESGKDEAPEAVFEHERIAFPSYPYEWAPEMLYGAGRLTLDLAESALTEGFGLKDATPTWLASKSGKDQAKIYRERRLGSAGQASYVLDLLFKRLRRQLKKVGPLGSRRSEWTDYVSFNMSHAPDYLAEKQAFVENALREFKPRNVLDVGCNTGYFSRIAARGGAGVVAIDQDPATVGELWREATASGLNILPLVLDLTRPSPSVGWRNGENLSFLERAQGAFDLALMLAVIHHMLVCERVPLDEILSLAGDLTTDLLIVEFVAPDDPMFQRLARGRDHLFKDLTNDAFRNACVRLFDVVLCRRLAGAHRWVYLLKKKRFGAA